MIEVYFKRRELLCSEEERSNSKRGQEGDISEVNLLLIFLNCVVIIII